MLIGRDGELRRIEGMLAAARAGRFSVLHVRGDPGIGKTALLDAAERMGQAHGMHVVRVTAVESEAGIASCGLDLLVAQLGGSAVGPGSPASLLEAMSATSSQAPLLLLLDDAQWLDDLSARAVSFACRRLLADPVVVLITSRTAAASAALEPFPTITLAPLGLGDSVSLLQHVAPEIPGDVARRVAGELAGVPLALVGVRDLLPADSLAGRTPLPSPIPVGRAVQIRYAEGIERLDARERLALVMLAADDTGDPSVIVQTLHRNGATVDDLVGAERLGLVRLDGIPRFAHPLARAAVHAAAEPEVTRAAHATLGAILQECHDTRALRHRALGSAGPDESVARDLEDAARTLATDSPRRASQLAHLAADLSPAPADRRRRLLLAAELSTEADRAVRLATGVLDSTDDPTERARATIVVADNLHRADPARVIELLSGVDASAVDDGVATEVLCRLAWGAMENLDLDLLGRLIATMGAADEPDWVLLSALGSALVFLGRNADGVRVLREANELSARVDPATLSTDLLTGWAVIPSWLGEDDAAARARSRTMDRLLRAHHRPMDLVYADFFSAERSRRDGAWDRSIALLTHGISLLHALGFPEGVDEARLAGLFAYRGEEDLARAHVDSAQQAFARRSSPWLELWVTHARGALALTMGRPAEAVATLAPLRGVPFVGRGCRDAPVSGLVDLIEALTLLGERGQAAEVFEDLRRMTDGLVDPLGQALVCRSRALVEPARADELLEAARAHLEVTTEAFETARTELHLGEHLRRTRRRRLARTHLMAAHDAFTQLGAQPWATRAHHELAATGAPVGAPGAPVDATPEHPLTPQELRIAIEVAHGLSNPQVASALFVSAKTVEFHLGKVYRKLGVRSRGGLAHALAVRGLLADGR